jgi:GDP-D-mannose dehydratase
MANADRIGTLRMLEAIRVMGPEVETRFYQASTSELLGLVQQIPQTEKTQFYLRSPYAVAKLYAHWITDNNREAYGIYARSGILFNHESPVRGETFVTRKITRGIMRIAVGIQDCLNLGNLAARRDRGHARDYVEMQWLMPQQPEPEDFVIVTGVQYSVRDFVRAAAAELGIGIRFQVDGVDEVGIIESIDGIACIYARDCPQPIKEEHRLSGPLEGTNSAYAIAKITGLKMSDAYNVQYRTRYIAAMPTNLYGPNDNYDMNHSHVLPALMRKAHEAKLPGSRAMSVWGSGTPRSEFLHVGDLVTASIVLIESDSDDGIFNVGVGEDVTVRALTKLVCDVVGFDGELVFDTSKPDGTPRKLLDVSKLKGLDWCPTISLRDGIEATYKGYLEPFSTSALEAGT